MKHTVMSMNVDSGETQIGYRPVHLYTLTKDIEPIPPKKRVY